jgi:hypothetical protein
MKVPSLADVAVDMYLPEDTAAGDDACWRVPDKLHSARGNHTTSAALQVQATKAWWFLLARLEVLAPAAIGTLVTFGDSITNGTRSSLDTDNRWPDHLARRLAAERGAIAGIAGNRVVSEPGNPRAGVNALARFDQDVLMQPGMTHVVVLEGINDIGGARENPSPGAADLVSGYRQLIERARYCTPEG